MLTTLHFNYHTCWLSGDNLSVRISAPVVSRWLWPGNGAFLEMASTVVTWWIVDFAQWQGHQKAELLFCMCRKNNMAPNHGTVMILWLGRIHWYYMSQDDVAITCSWSFIRITFMLTKNNVLLQSWVHEWRL